MNGLVLYILGTALTAGLIASADEKRGEARPPMETLVRVTVGSLTWPVVAMLCVVSAIGWFLVAGKMDKETGGE